jgi:hypothetical protein
MLEYAKIILPKVSFSRELFEKELNKCINWVDKSQRHELYAWCHENFDEMYHDILSRAFAGIAA